MQKLVPACVSLVLSGLLGRSLGAQFPQPFRGNPTPGTEQPKPPDPADRVTFTGCLKQVIAEISPGEANTPSDSHFVLSEARREKKDPAGSGAASSSLPASSTYRLFGIDSVMASLAGSRVKISGDFLGVSGAENGQGAATPVLRVLYAERLAKSCR